MTTTRSTYEDFLAWLQDSRTHGQVHFNDKQQCWQVLGHPEANAILADSARFSSDLSALVPAGGPRAVPAWQLRPDGPPAAPQAA
jgi:hypothetical protein